MKILYISISGNTRSFVQKLQNYAAEIVEKNKLAPEITLEEIHENSIFKQEQVPFFAFVPTYLDGGNGVDNGDHEILTEDLREYIEFENNASYCLGVIGSGNRNFNRQYCLTAKQYAEQFAIPFLADFELRGTTSDVARIYQVLVNRMNEHNKQ